MINAKDDKMGDFKKMQRRTQRIHEMSVTLMVCNHYMQIIFVFTSERR